MKNYTICLTTGEVHRTRHRKALCNTDKIKPENRLECGWIRAMFYIHLLGFDGCGHCWKSKNTTGK